MKKMLSAAAAAALTLTASSALAAPLVNPTVTLSNNGLAQPTAITATYTTATIVNPGEYILMAGLPTGFTKIGAVQINDCTGVTLKVDGVLQSGGNAPTCSLYMGGVVSLQANATVAGGATVEVHLDATRFTTPATPGLKTFSGFSTASFFGDPINDAVPLPSVTIAAPAAVPTLTEWAMILLTVALGGFAALTINKRRRTV